MRAADLYKRLIARIENLERVNERMSIRMNNMIREASVVSVDHDAGTVVVSAHGLESRSVPWATQAGHARDWEPPKVGQRVTLFSPGGDVNRAFVMLGGYTDDAPSPSNSPDSYVRKMGSTTITTGPEGYSLETGTITLKGNVVIEGNVSITGNITSTGSVTNNGKDVGSTHTNAMAPVD